MLRLNYNLESNITHGVNHIIIVAGDAARPMHEDKGTSPRWDNDLRADNGGYPQS